MPRQSPRTALLLALPSALLLTLVATGWFPLLTLDEDIARVTHRWAFRERGLTQTFRVLTDWVWDPVTMRLLCAGVALWLVWRRAAWWTALWLLVTCAVAAVVQQAVKAGVARPRPVWPDPVDSARFAAFPSGHAMTATVVWGLLLWLIREHGVRGPRWYGAVALAVVSVLGVGLTRVWLGVHWFSDVLGGWLFGASVVAGAVLVHERGSRVRP
ncbi:phosphatase PAP2 family protein [Streptomyces bauhiniae]|uniref:Phosphatase PAP2 family protein n=1 Tax=Streptomyces bauhiniae TaxID=2340725 RepID=A0A7K3QQJ5_9ACTN|nr:phosphatase PAP2 family protein [Streptomyces bauhiniae]NEB92103.1 phosphatase PAP2 family protein [Streptomyces bauhiniae]